MGIGSGQADDPAPVGQQAEPAVSSPSANRLVAWHGDLTARLDRLGWLRTVSDWLSAVLGPVRERHQDNLAVELLHGGRWVGHPLHPALSDLPIGLWAGVMVLDATDRDPAPRRGIDAAGMLSAAGLLAAGATVLTGLTTGPSATIRTAASGSSTASSTRRPSGCKVPPWAPAWPATAARLARWAWPASRSRPRLVTLAVISYSPRA